MRRVAALPRAPHRFDGGAAEQAEIDDEHVHRCLATPELRDERRQGAASNTMTHGTRMRRRCEHLEEGAMQERNAGSTSPSPHEQSCPAARVTVDLGACPKVLDRHAGEAAHGLAARRKLLEQS